MMRIIPARAGFTISESTRACGCRDHPRSRGVYTASRQGWHSRQGSSPLARGLQACRGRQGYCRRIIPARAGFTVGGDLSGGLGGDHPRSRGVYVLWTTLTTKGHGSSPLARGLPTPQAPTRPMTGIIPARAGFTRSPALTSPVPRDHPRSRGVYHCGSPWGFSGDGSSPLARGLLKCLIVCR